MQRRRSTSNKPDYKEKKRYKEKKDVIHKRREKRKLEQREGE
jgi:hypothetical protein